MKGSRNPLSPDAPVEHSLNSLKNVNLYSSGKMKSNILREYDLNLVTLDCWINENQSTGSFKEVDNRSPEKKEFIELCKLNQQLEMEIDILKQSALIMGQSKDSK